MGIVNLFKGLDLQKEIYNFNGSIRENLNLNWDYVKIYKGEKELDPDYHVQDDDIIIIQEYPQGLTTLVVTAIVVGVISLGVGVGTAIYAKNQADKAKKDMEDALSRIGKSNKQSEVSSIPGLSGAKNERVDGKNAPVIIGRHLFTPYFLSDPYMRPSGTDGKDLYWYGTFIAGQNGLCFEKIRNGLNNLVTFTENNAQTGREYFDRPANYNSANPPPFYDPENFIEIAQGNYPFTEEIFEQKWVDSLDSTVELGREKLDEAGTVYDSTLGADVINDKGADPIIRETARFPMRAEIEIFIDGLHGWDSHNGVETPATVGVKIEWSTSADGGWENIPILWNSTSLSKITYPASSISIWDLRIRLAARFGQTVSDNMNFHLQTDSSIGGQKITDITVYYTSTLVNAMYFQNNGTVVHYQPFRTLDGITLLSKELIITGYESSDSGSETITRAKAEQMRFLATVNFPARIFSKEGNPVFIKATRTTKMYSGSYRDRVYLSAIRTQQYNPKELPKDNDNKLVAAKNLNERFKPDLSSDPIRENKFCRIGIKIKANKNTQEALDRFNIVASMTARTWDGQKWSEKKTKTSNPGAIALEILTGLIHDPSKYKDDEINRTSFGKLYKYCQNREVKITGEKEPREFDIEANGVVSSGTKKLDILKSVLAVCDAGLYVDEFGKFHVYYDDRQSTPIALLNPQRIVKINEQRSLERKTDGYTVEFVNQEVDWSTDTHRILKPRVEENPGLNTFTSIKLDYTTSYYQAMWHARRMMAKEIHRPGELKITVGKEGRLYTPGSLIKVQHEGLKKGLGSGEIMQVIYSADGKFINGFKLMEEFDISEDMDYFIEYFVVKDNADPHVVEATGTLKLQSVGKYTDTLMLTTPIPASSFYTPDMGNPLSVWYGKINEYNRYVVSELSENNDGYDLTLFPYSNVIYDTTSIDEIDPYQTSILNAPPKVYDNYEPMPIDREGGQGIPNTGNVINIAREAAQDALDEAVKMIDDLPPSTPRYRGAANTPLDNSGYDVNGNKMNHGDYVMYTGGNTGDWQYAYIMRWDDNAKTWKRLAMPAENPANGWMYLDGISDLTKGAKSEVFSNVFTESIAANSAFIRDLFTKTMILRQNGVIQSENNVNDPNRGFIIKADGSAVFNDITLRNNIKAIGGTFENITVNEGKFSGITVTRANLTDLTVVNGNFNDISIGGNSFFGGNINSKVLEASDFESIQYFYASYSDVYKAIDELRPIIGIGNVAAVTGTYRWAPIYGISIIISNDYYVLRLYTNTNLTAYEVAGGAIEFTSDLSFKFTATSVLKFKGLQTTIPVEKDVVFKETDGKGNYYLKIKN